MHFYKGGGDNQSMKKYIVGAVLSIGILVSPVFAQASGLTSAQVQSILSLLSAFGADSATIANVNAALTGGTSTGGGTQPWCHTFNTNLKIGDSGSDVRALGTVLTKEGFGNARYAEGLVDPISDTGDFIEPTAAAVSGFQEKYTRDILTPSGLSHGTGYVGVATRAKLNSLYGCNNPRPTTPVTATQPSVTVLNPNGGNVWKIGIPYDIYWNSNNFSGGVVNLELVNYSYNPATEDNRTHYWIATNTNNTGNYQWTVSNYPQNGSNQVLIPGNNFKIRISAYKETSGGLLDYNNLVQGDESDAPFAITN